MNYNYTVCCWFPTTSNSLILPSQFWQIRFESKLLIALFKVPNTGAFTVYMIKWWTKLDIVSIFISWNKGVIHRFYLPLTLSPILSSLESATIALMSSSVSAPGGQLVIFLCDVVGLDKRGKDGKAVGRVQGAVIVVVIHSSQFLHFTNDRNNIILISYTVNSWGQ